MMILINFILAAAQFVLGNCSSNLINFLNISCVKLDKFKVIKFSCLNCV